MMDFDRCLSLVNRNKEIDVEIDRMNGKPGAFIYVLFLQLEKEVLTKEIEAIYSKYDQKN